MSVPTPTEFTRPKKTLPSRFRSRLSNRLVTLLLFVSPSILFLLIINAYPVVYAALQSVHDGSLLSTGQYVGLSNYTDLINDPIFWQSARFTVLFTIVGVFGSWILGLSLALLLSLRIPAGNVFKVLLLLPWIVPVVVSTTSWNWLVATPQSPIPSLIRDLGGGEVLFLANPTTAVVTVLAFKVWASFPFMMIMSSAALTAVDGSLYDSAQVDGASKWQRLRFITMPMIARSTYISWILMTIFCVNDFPSIYLLTGGGPINATMSLVVLAFQTVFLNFQTGPGTAMAFVMTIVLIAVSVILYRQIKRAAI